MKIVTDENSERVARYAFEYGNLFVLHLIKVSNLSLTYHLCAIQLPK